MIMKDLKNTGIKLPTKADLVKAELCDQDLHELYEDLAGDIGLMWKIPSLGSFECLGAIIVPVQEGILSIPYFAETFTGGADALRYDEAYILDRKEIKTIVKDLMKYVVDFATEMEAGLIMTQGA
jgi:hypothetical protein